jgi:hypothetical protein
VDGGGREVHRPVLPEPLPEERGAVGVGEVAVLAHVHALRDRSKRERDLPARRRRQVVEVRKEPREPGATDLDEARLAELGVVVVHDDVGDTLVDRGPHVVRSDVEEAREVEKTSAPEIFDIEPIDEVAWQPTLLGLGIGQERRQQEDDEAHAEERRDRPYSAPQGEGEHDATTIQFVCPC